jgi:hypothetical protein
MAEDLRRYLDDEPILARRASSWERFVRWSRRNRYIAGLAAAVFVLLVAVAVVSLASAARQERLRQQADATAAREREANRISQRLRGEADEAREQAEAERDRSRRLSAGLALDRGLALAEAGEPDRGLIWMLEAWKTAPADADDLRRCALQNLAAWEPQVHRLVKIYRRDPPGRIIRFTRDGRRFATSDYGRPITVHDTATGRRLSMPLEYDRLVGTTELPSI